MLETKIKAMRKARGMSQQDVADKLQVTDGAVDHWESGRRKPSIETVIKLTHIFDCTINDLLEDDNDNERPQSPNE